MKLPSHNLSRQSPVRVLNVRAFTLVELMVTMAVFLMLVLAMVSVQIFGFRLNMLTTSKAKFMANSLKVLDQVQSQVRNSSSPAVGNGTSLASFSPTGTSGNALLIYSPTNAPTPGTNLIYLATNTGTLYEIYGANNTAVTIASHITNAVVFQAVNCYGSTSVSSVQHFAIRMTLNFFLTNYTIPANVCESYTFQTEMTPRTQN